MENDDMATQAPNAAPLPLLYNGLEPVNSGQHGKMKLKKAYTLPQVGQTHAIPITVEEFTVVQRHYPIICPGGEIPLPLAQVGLNEGEQTLVDTDGGPLDKNSYIPAY